MPRSWTPSADLLRSPSVVGHGSTTQLPPSAKVPRKAPAPPFSRPSSPSIGQTYSRFSPYARHRPPPSPMAYPSTTSCYTSTFSPTCLDATPNIASPFFDSSLTGTPTAFTTYPSTFRPTSPNTCSTPSPQSPTLLSHGRRHLTAAGNSSSSTRSRGTNSFAAGEVSSPCTKIVAPDASALLGSTNGTYSITSAKSFDIDRAPPRGTARPTVYTARCASGPHTANYRGPGAKSSPRPGTASSRATPGLAASALQLFRPVHTFGTRPAMALVVRQSRPSHLNG